MKRTFLRISSVVLGVVLSMGTWVRIEGAPAQKFSDAELDELLAPIALYPDPLLAQVIPASTFVEQLETAQRTLGGKSDDNLIANQNWDVSVKSVAHYPPVLKMMVDKLDWTTAIGQAYVSQSTDVGKSIQRLRAQAKAAGSLVTTPQQQVISEGQTIKIVPAQPQVIYVPQYNPETVYVKSGPSTGAVVATAALSFTAGLAIGAWLNNDWDYHGRGIYYHGWNGAGWIGANRAYANVNRNVYINNSYSNINVNRNVVNRDINNYRTSVNRNATVRQENINRANLNSTNSARTNASRKNLNTGKAGTRNATANSANRTGVNANETAKTRSATSARTGATGTGAKGAGARSGTAQTGSGAATPQAKAKPHTAAASTGAHKTGGQRRK